MITKESAATLLKVLSQIQIAPMQEGADQSYAAIAKARDELKKIMAEPNPTPGEEDEA